MKSTGSKQRPPGKLTSKQLLEISQGISRTFSHQITSNISELMILPVDPYHLYAYWHLDDQQSSDVNTDSNQKLLLKVYWQNDQDKKQDPSKLCFNVNLDSTHSQQKIRLPVDASNYSAAIGTLDENQCWNMLARSNTIHIPAASVQPKIQNIVATPANIVQTIIVEDNTKSTESTESTDKSAYDEIQVNAKIKQILFKKYGLNNADVLLASGAITTDTETAIHPENNYDENLIDASILQALHKNNLNPQLTHKTLNLNSHYAASIFSGQNLYF
ncbi:MAG: DUF4912 domain-containing protein [Methylococcales bacterium]